jgi:hypothetical protein
MTDTLAHKVIGARLYNDAVDLVYSAVHTAETYLYHSKMTPNWPGYPIESWDIWVGEEGRHGTLLWIGLPNSIYAGIRYEVWTDEHCLHWHRNGLQRLVYSGPDRVTAVHAAVKNTGPYTVLYEGLSGYWFQRLAERYKTRQVGQRR